MNRARIAWKVVTFPIRVALVIVGALVGLVVLACAIAWEERGSDVEGGQ